MSDQPPRYVFLDTEFFDRLQFDFQNPLLKGVVSHAEKGRLQLVLPKVIEGEIRDHLRGKAVEAITLKTPPLLRNSRLDAVAQRMAPIDVEPLLAEASQDLDDFLASCKVIRLDTDEIPLSRIQDEYIAKRPPFNGGNPKAQFPDGYAIASMRDWSAANNGERIAVVTYDAAFKDACDAKGGLVAVELPEHLSSLQASELALARAAATPSTVNGDAGQVTTERDDGDDDDGEPPSAEVLERLEAIVRKGLADNHAVISAKAKEQFEWLGFYLAEVDGEVEEVRVKRVEYDDIDFLSLDPNDAVVEISCTFDFDADVTFKVPGTGTYDSEDRVLLFQEERSNTTERSVTRPVLVEVSIDEDDERGVFCSITNVSLQDRDDVEIENPEDDDWPYK
jgi:hypothetical protein